LCPCVVKQGPALMYSSSSSSSMKLVQTDNESAFVFLVALPRDEGRKSSHALRSTLLLD
jgi:hypothetical protein